MTDVQHTDGPDSTETREPVNGTPTNGAEDGPGLLVSRRGALLGGALGLAAAVSVAEPDLALATTPTPVTNTVALPATTAPEQLRLAWGADPTTQVTVSFSAPGTVAMPAPTLAYSTSPITAMNPGTLVTLPAVTPFSLSAPRTGPSSTSFTDGLSQQTTYHYHVPLSGLAPNTRYYYEVSDGATPTPSTASGAFMTAPTGRAAYRFTAFGDIGTPYTANPSRYTWKESSDVSIFTVDGVVAPGDGNGAGLFHLMLADLSYANANPANTPNIWRDYQSNASKASANQPWMPIQGNHEVELGVCSVSGTPSSGTVTPATAYNGPYGAGNYLARHLLPDNGLTNYDGNRLQGSFYSFQVGTVLFICLNTNDVVFQYPQTVSNASTSYAGTYNGATIPSGTVGIQQYQATGGFTPEPADLQLVPNTAAQPNLQTQWLEQQLQAARAEGSSVDMIVVCEHHCALSSGPNNGVDLAIRAAWLPLYDEYEVDLVIGGHDHDYERSYPVRGYDAGAPGTATAAFTDPFGNSYTAGQAVNTRRPTVVSTEPTTLADGAQAWNTAAGTVFLQLGGAGAIGGPLPSTDSSTGLRQAVVWATPGGVNAKQCATEDATWSAMYDTSDNYGYAVFDVRPGSAPGETALSYQWFQVPAVANGGTATPQTTPYEAFVFTRMMPAGQVTIAGAGSGSVPVGSTLTAVPSGFAAGASFAYAWQRNGTAIPGASAASYTTAAADVGQTLSVTVIAAAQSYPSSTLTIPAPSVYTPPSTTPVIVGTSSSTTTSSSPSSPNPTASSPTPTATSPGLESAPALSFSGPRVSGVARVGSALTAQVAVFATPGSLAYQWLRDGHPISGATSDTYTPTAADAGHRLTVEVTDTNGGSSATELSAPVEVVAEAFTRTVVPTINGTAEVGHTVEVDPGTWSPQANFEIQWLLDGRAIPGATRRTLKLKSRYAGQRLSVAVTGTRTGYRSHRVSSAHVLVTAAPLPARRPRISGKAVVGETLHAHLGAWPKETEFAYRWYVGGRAVPGATGHALRVLPAYRGQRVTLEVTSRLTGHAPVRATSAPTRAVRRGWSLL